MVRIRLRRVGLKGQPSYRIVAAEKESPRDGKFLEILGDYNPRTEPFTFQVNEERVYHWLKNGAQPSESVAMLFKSVGLTERFERVKAGEPAEAVLKEAEEFYNSRKVNPKTR
jgi:small subunit ribosomal protein S16